MDAGGQRFRIGPWLSLPLGLLWVANSAAAPTAAPVPEMRLEKVVMLQRHGLRSPTQTPEQLAPSATRPWPDWGIGPGELTVHGAQLIGYLGGYFRTHYAALGVLPTEGCPASGTFAVWSDNSTRRVPLSGQVLVEALFPGCDLRTGFQPQTEPDALFHPVELGVCSLHPARAEAAVLERVDDDLDRPMRANREALQYLQSLLKQRYRRVCARSAGSCGIDGFANVIQATPDSFVLAGGLQAATTAGENILLAYLQGLPLEQVGWGDVTTEEQLHLLLAPRNHYLDLTRRTPYLAARHGTPLAQLLLAALEDDPAASPGAAGAALGGATHFAAIVGRDIHLAVIGGLLGLDWLLEGQPDLHGSGVTLALERWRDPDSGAAYIKPVVYYQTLAQMREAQPLDPGNPPGRVALQFSGCTNHQRDGACALAHLKPRIVMAMAEDCRTAP